MMSEAPESAPPAPLPNASDPPLAVVEFEIELDDIYEAARQMYLHSTPHRNVVQWRRLKGVFRFLFVRSPMIWLCGLGVVDLTQWTSQWTGWYFTYRDGWRYLVLFVTGVLWLALLHRNLKFSRYLTIVLNQEWVWARNALSPWLLWPIRIELHANGLVEKSTWSTRCFAWAHVRNVLISEEVLVVDLLDNLIVLPIHAFASQVDMFAFAQHLQERQAEADAGSEVLLRLTATRSYKCLKCGYRIDKVPTTRCPECGRNIDIVEFMRRPRV